MRATSFFVVVGVAVTMAIAPHAWARKKTPSEAVQRRALIEQLAAASAEIPPDQRTDADLMYAAMKQWRGEPRGSAAVDKAIAQSKSDALHDHKALEARLRTMFWKDPFSSEVVPVLQKDRDLLHEHAQRVARAHGDASKQEVARLRAALATVRAENIRLQDELARLQEKSTDVEGDTRASFTPPPRRLQARSHAGSGRGGHRDSGFLEGLNGSRPTHRRRSKRVLADSAPPPPPPPPVAPVTAPPPGWHSSDPRGIIVVPISTPVPIQADNTTGRAR